jgi:hypothetical protein
LEESLNVHGSRGVVISVASYVPEAAYEDAVDDFGSAGFQVALEKRDPEVFAALEYLMPTAIVVYVLRPYVEKFLSKMAEDNYNSCKSALQKLWSHFLSNLRNFHSKRIGTKGKLSDNALAFELSLIAKTADNQSFRLLFPHSISASEFQKAIVQFYSLMEQHERAPQSSILNRSCFNGGRRVSHSQRVLTWASDSGRLVEIDILESSRQGKLVFIEIGGHLV